MSLRTLQRMAALMLLPICVGCASGGSIIRSQSPNGEIPHARFTSSGHRISNTRQVAHQAQPVSHVEEYYQNCEPNQQYEQNERIWPHQYIMGHFMARHHDGDRHKGVGTGMLHHHGPVGDWHPTHYHSYSYEQPKNLVYPANNIPAGMIQYPYYTVKGPSDFFMK